jgi:hypothetical protein
VTQTSIANNLVLYFAAAVHGSDIFSVDDDNDGKISC